MTELTLSSSQVAQLDPTIDVVECRDPAGKLVGFLHLAAAKESLSIPEFTADQLAAFEREPGGRSLAEILSDLRQRQ